MIPSSTPPQDAVLQRRKAFVGAAREAFFAHGYAGTTMSSIATIVGGSKTTLWSYFPSKDELFAAVVDDIAELYGQALSVELSLEDNVKDVLLRFARALMDTILSEPIIALHRLVLAEATRFPGLAGVFYDRGPRRGKVRLAEYVEKVMDRGLLRRGDSMLAVHQLCGLCQSGYYQLALLNLEVPQDANALDDEINAAVDTFYRAWKPEG